ncbi:hypothetical protein [Luteolibacter soli]|uniref:Uncharacterized protein n=1 Tax=Luteolibacter soli TaxID=3135280 RepID=A0ABU9B2T6_9BACT
MSDNPYQAPAVQEVVAPAVPLTDAEAIRTKHLKHEASLKAIGFLYFLGAVLVAVSLVGLIAVYGRMRTSSESALGSWDWSVMGALVAICIGQFVAGWGLRKLRPWAKIPGALVAAISMIKFPVGTVIGAYVLYLIFCPKGRTVLSPAYAEIVAQTPHLRYRTPRWIWILLAVVVLLFLGLLFFGGVAPSRR